MNAVVIDKVRKSFGELRAVDDLDVRVPAGSIYGFLGPNGAGKTTTIRMVMNIIAPDRGRIEIMGIDAAKCARDRVGYLPEERGLYSKMRVRKVLGYLAAIKGMDRAARKKAVPRWLEKVELTKWADRKVEELSKGMQQKLQFAATVIHDPDVLVLDEPFAGLDPINIEMLKRIILDLREEGKTIVLSTHMMEHAENLCDYILLIDRGRAVVDGRLDDVRARYESNSLILETDGDVDGIGDIEGVERVVRDGRKIEIMLKEDTDSQDVLKELVERVRIRSVEIKRPSLHEIFVHLVGNSNGQNP